MERELRRGTLEMLLLGLLDEVDRYGYELVAELDRRSDGRMAVKDGTLYPVLYRLEEAGKVEPYWQAEGRGVPRKYYRITEAGRAELERSLEEWYAFVETVAMILGPMEGRS